MIYLPAFPGAQTITTIAGNGTQGYNGDGISATSGELNGPQGMALDASGNIYIADLQNNRIRKIDISTGLISTIAGTGTGGYNGDGISATSADISSPSALSFDNAGNLYFSDRANDRVRKINMSTGIISTVAGTGTGGYNGDGIAATSAELNFPNEVSFDASGNLYIADWLNNRVRKVDMSTGLISTVVGTGTGGYNGDGIAATSAEINSPCGINFDAAGDMYVVEYGGMRIRKINTTGTISTVVGTGTGGYNGDGIIATSAKLDGPAYISFDNAGDMFIGDAINQRVREVSSSTGLISTFAGNGTGGFNGDGIAATSAELDLPFFVYFDTLRCCLYIADYANYRIRKITVGLAGGCTPPVAPGNLVSCQVLPAVTINALNDNTWVPIYDSVGNIAAQINANGNVLGTVNTSLYTKNGACRQDNLYRLYLNRNITITPQNQPGAGQVSLRLYLLKTELDSLETATNSLGQSSGVMSISNLAVFSNEDACSSVGGNLAQPLVTTSASYNSDYYLQTNVSGFSSFYFASGVLSSILSMDVLSFSGHRAGTVNSLQWASNCAVGAGFDVERSYDGLNFENIGTVKVAADCSGTFSFNDDNALPDAPLYYYRLKLTMGTALVAYSKTIQLSATTLSKILIQVSPNPVQGSTIHAMYSAPGYGSLQVEVADPVGRMLFRQVKALIPGSNTIDLDGSKLSSGIYFLYGMSSGAKTNIVRFVKQ